MRVLQQVYPENKEPFHAHLAPLLAILEHSECDPSEKLSILQLAAMVANYKPEVSQVYQLHLYARRIIYKNTFH